MIVALLLAVPVVISHTGGIVALGGYVGSIEPRVSGWWFTGKDIVALGMAVGLSIAAAPLEAAYVGLGSDADFAGRDVNGKAAVVFTMVGLRPEQASKRADAKGAKVILSVDGAAVVRRRADASGAAGDCDQRVW
jgi:hypothetical protein